MTDPDDGLTTIENATDYDDATEASCTPPGPDNPPPDVPDNTPVWALDQP